MNALKKVLLVIISDSKWKVFPLYAYTVTQQPFFEYEACEQSSQIVVIENISSHFLSHAYVIDTIYKKYSSLYTVKPIKFRFHCVFLTLSQLFKNIKAIT